MSRARVPHTRCALAGTPGHRCTWLQACCAVCKRSRQPDERGWIMVRELSDDHSTQAHVYCSENCRAKGKQ